MIELSDVSIRSGSFALDHISFRVATGQYAVLMGRTGMGKTTILEAICGLRKIARGTVRIHEHDVTRWSPRDRQIGYVPQDLALFPSLSVREHLEFGLRLRKAPAATIKQRTEELSNVLGLTHYCIAIQQDLAGRIAARCFG